MNGQALRRAYPVGMQAPQPTLLLPPLPCAASQPRHPSCLPLSAQTFALSALECAAVLEAADQRSDRGCDFFHDPNKGGPGEGTIAKSLRCCRGAGGQGALCMHASPHQSHAC